MIDEKATAGGAVAVAIFFVLCLSTGMVTATPDSPAFDTTLIGGTNSNQVADSRATDNLSLSTESTLITSRTTGDVPTRVLNATYGDSKDNGINNIISTKDGNYLLMGVDFTNGSSEGSVRKVTPQGSVIWERDYGNDSDQALWGGIQTESGGFVLSGHTETAESYTGWGLMIDQDGDKLWEIEQDGSEGIFYDVESTSNNRYLFAGEYNSSDGDDNAEVVKVSSSGVKIWEFSYYSNSPSNNQDFFGIEQLEPNKFAVVGQEQFDDQNWDATVFNLNSNGEILSQDDYGHSTLHDWFIDVAVTESGKPVYVGQRNGVFDYETNEYNFIDGWVYYDGSSRTWSKEVSVDNLTRFGSIGTDGDRIVAAGVSSTEEGGQRDGLVTEYDLDGTRNWRLTTNERGDYSIDTVLARGDYTYVAGDINNSDSDSFNAVLRKYTSSGFVDVDPSDLAGSGTTLDPYIITNASELQAMEDNLDAHYELGSDIDASGTAQWNDGKGFNPVGDADSKFTGGLNGNNHTLTELTINRSEEGHVGLVGYANSTVTISDMSVRNITLNGDFQVGSLVGRNAGGSIEHTDATGDINGLRNVGGLVGAQSNHGIIRSSTVTANINGSRNIGGVVGGSRNGSIESVAATTTINGSRNVGGVIGFNRGKIRYVTATGRVTGSRTVGGLAGVNAEGAIRNATSTSDVTGSRNVGGLAGVSSGAIQNATAAGNVSGSGDIVGGLIGVTLPNATIQNATAAGSVNGVDGVGGLIGANRRRATIKNAMATGPVNGSEIVGGFVGVNRGTIRSAFATGLVTGSTTIGGFVGNQSEDGTIQHSYWDEQSTGQTTSGGANATGLTTAQMTGESARTNMSGLDFNSIWKTKSNQYPALTLQTSNINGDITVPPRLKEDVTGKQYAAVLDGDDNLTASNLAAAINGWADNGEVNGTGIGAFELSKLINYWANS